MARVLTISVVWLLCAAAASAQLRSLGGSVSYNRQYYDSQIGDRLQVSESGSPSVNLLASGVILGPQLAEFYVQSFLSQSSLTSRAGGPAFEFESLNWTLYQLNLSLFQYSPAWLMLRFRDGLNASKSAYAGESGGIGRLRSTEQQTTLTLKDISFLPPMTLDYGRAHAWSVEGAASNTRSQSFTFAANAATKSGSLSVAGTTSITDDLLANSQTRFSTARLNAAKNFSDLEILNLQSEYSWYDRIGVFTGSLSYSGVLDSSINVGTGIGLNQTTNPFSTTSALSGSAGASFAQGERWRFGVNAATVYNRSAPADANSTQRTAFYGWTAGASVSHQREIGGGMMGNSVSVNGGWETLDRNGTSLGGGVSNSFSRGFGQTQCSITQTFTMSVGRRNGEQQFRTSDRLAFAADTRIGRDASNKVNVSYGDNHSTGELEQSISTRSASLGDGAGARFNIVIPFSVGAGASVSWYSGGISGRTHGWNFNFASPRFFLDRLGARYDYTRAYDIALNREALDQSAEFKYAWRMFDFSLRMHQHNLLTRQRDISFNVSRPF